MKKLALTLGLTVSIFFFAVSQLIDAIPYNDWWTGILLLGVIVSAVIAFIVAPMVEGDDTPDSWMTALLVVAASFVLLALLLRLLPMGGGVGAFVYKALRF